MTRIFFVAGESSGDIHGANLIRALREREPELVCEGLGGTRMAAEGMTLRYDLAGRAIMGFVEVLKSLRFIRRLFYETLETIKVNPPDCLVLLDYPGFNLELAKRVKPLGIPIVYYISPQVWAWKKKRIHTIARLVDKMLVILPFEEKLYRDIGVDGVYVGHPLLDQIPRIEVTRLYPGEMVVGLLPGSREQEIRRILPPMLASAEVLSKELPGTRFVIPCVDEARAAQIRALVGAAPIDVFVGQMYDVLHSARFCMVASGTATVETALFGVPFVILYRMAPATYAIAKRLVKIEHIGMVNILANKRIVPEFIQHEACAERIVPVARELIRDSAARTAMLRALEQVKQLLGGPGASMRAASEVFTVIARRQHG